MGKKIKTCLIGDSSVGKTSIVLRLTDKTYKPTVNSTVSVDFRCDSKTINGEQISVEIWDTSGQDKYRAVAKNYFRQADGLFIVFAADDDRSLEAVKYWCEQLRENVSNDVPRVLLANKCDLKK